MTTATMTIKLKACTHRQYYMLKNLYECDMKMCVKKSMLELVCVKSYGCDIVRKRLNAVSRIDVWLAIV